MFACFSPFILIIFGATFFFYKRGRRYSKAVFLWLTTLFISFFFMGLEVWFYNFDAPKVEQGEQKANLILLAIDQYYTDKDQFPTTLNTLVPDYLSYIPKASWRQNYCYDLRENGESFTLAFVPQDEAIGDGWDVYSSLLDSWRKVDSDFYQPCHFSFDLHEITQ